MEKWETTEVNGPFEMTLPPPSSPLVILGETKVYIADWEAVEPNGSSSVPPESAFWSQDW